jgi:hypothetical protein
MALAVVIVAMPTASEGKAARCQLSERDFLGNWSSPAGDEIEANDVRALAFEYVEHKRIYGEWLHHRPMGSGSWQYSSCVVTVDDHGAILRFRFLGNDRRRLVEIPYTRGSSIYRRVR